MNSVSLTGTLVRDPEVKARGDRKICELRLAETGGRKDAPLFVSVSTFGRQAETCGEFLSKGRHIAVTGQLRFREWEAEGGGKRSEISIAADRVDFLASPQKTRGKGGGGRGSGNGGGGRREGSSRGSGGFDGGGFGGGEGGFDEGAPAYGGGGESGF
jgi:single-strand DNA-binding protein